MRGAPTSRAASGRGSARGCAERGGVRGGRSRRSAAGAKQHAQSRLQPRSAAPRPTCEPMRTTVVKSAAPLAESTPAALLTAAHASRGSPVVLKPATHTKRPEKKRRSAPSTRLRRGSGGAPSTAQSSAAYKRAVHPSPSHVLKTAKARGKATSRACTTRMRQRTSAGAVSGRAAMSAVLAAGAWGTSVVGSVVPASEIEAEGGAEAATPRPAAAGPSHGGVLA